MSTIKHRLSTMRRPRLLEKKDSKYVSQPVWITYELVATMSEHISDNSCLLTD